MYIVTHTTVGKAKRHPHYELYMDEDYHIALDRYKKLVKKENKIKVYLSKVEDGIETFAAKLLRKI
jgi:hypothetical protein